MIKFWINYSLKLVILPGNVHLPISSFIAAIKGMAGSFAWNLPSAKTRSTSTLGVTRGVWNWPALNGLTSGDGALLAHAPLSGSFIGPCNTFLGSDVFGRGLILGCTSSSLFKLQGFYVWCKYFR